MTWNEFGRNHFTVFPFIMSHYIVNRHSRNTFQKARGRPTTLSEGDASQQGLGHASVTAIRWSKRAIGGFSRG